MGWRSTFHGGRITKIENWNRKTFSNTQPDLNTSAFFWEEALAITVYVMIFIMLNKIWFKLNWNLTVCFYYTPKYKITNILMIPTVYKLKWRYLIRKQDPTGYQNKGISKLDVRKRRGISVDRAEDSKDTLLESINI